MLRSALHEGYDGVVRAVVVWTTALTLAAAGSLAAQDPLPPAPVTVTVTGTVSADQAGSRIPNAIVSIPARAAAVLSGDDGEFTLESIPLGTQILRVRQFGYEDLVVVLDVREGMAPLDLRLQPNPLELEALSVEVDGAVTLTGRVLHARARVGMAGVYVWLPSADMGVTTDSTGAFMLPAVPTGPHLVWVEEAGYGRHTLPIEAVPPWEPIVIELHPDDAVLRGLPLAERELRIRRNRFIGAVEAFDADRLRALGVRNVWKVVQSFSFADVVPCDGNGISAVTEMPMPVWCIGVRGRTIAPIVCIDGRLRLGGLDVLRRYRPQELAGLEVFGTAGAMIRGYTHRYMESLARREDRRLLNIEPEAGAETGRGWVTRDSEWGPTRVPNIPVKREGVPC